MNSLGLLQTGILTRLEVPQVRKDAFLPFLRRVDRPAKGFKAERQSAYWLLV